MSSLQHILRSILVICLATLISNYAKASHIMGGQITYECQGNGQFVFSVRIYYDCMSSTTLQTNLNLQIASSSLPSVNGVANSAAIPLNLISDTDRSPICNAAGPTISCTATLVVQGAFREFLFQTPAVTLDGSIPADGWTFCYVVNFRTTTITNLNSVGSQPMVIYTTMYGFNGQVPNPCYDSSPQVETPPVPIVCVGSPIDYNMVAADPDADNLTYEFAKPLYGDITDPISGFPVFNPPAIPQEYPFSAGYSYTNPMPDASFDPQNIPATLDATTGNISFLNYTLGTFILPMLVKSYRCGQLVSAMYREFNIFMTAGCQNNLNPTINPIPPGGNSTDVTLTVNAGDLVTFPIGATDNGVLANGSPQSVSFQAYGNQFGANYTSAITGCDQPPCATLNPPPTALGVGGTQTTFTWQTDCDHIAANNVCVNNNNSYTFSFVFQDDNCPIPSYSTYNVTVNIIATGTGVSPEMRCVQVNPNGTVTLNWSQIVDASGTWQGYAIYHSTARNGTFTQIGTVTDINTLTYTDAAANGCFDSNFYYVTSLYSCVDAPYINIMAAMQLDVRDGLGGTAFLDWNAISIPALPSSATTYNIYREFPTGTWTLIGTTSNTNYSDEVTVCGNIVNYRVELTDASGCTSISCVDGKYFEDNNVPNVPILDSVSVDLDSCYAFIGWTRSTSTDATCYIAYVQQAGIWAPIDTICGDSLFANAYATDLCLAAQCIRIAAMDSCGNVSPLGDIHCSTHMNGEINICDRRISLNWTDYTGWVEGVSSYTVLRNDDNQGYVNFGTTDANTTFFVDSFLETGHLYCYYIRANQNVANGFTASSNYLCFDASLPKAPDFGYVTTATVEDNGDAYISALIDQTAIIHHFDVQRKTVATDFEYLGTVDSIDFTGTDLVQYTDQTAQTDLISYSFRFITFDTCLTATDTTNIGTTIHINANGLENRTNVLSWNPYSNWEGNVDYYNIFRRVEGLETTSFSFLATVPSTSDTLYTFIDPVDTFTVGDGRFCYFVIGYEGQGNTFGITAKSKSNVDCAEQAANFFIPNSFSPIAWNRENRIFKPVTLFISREDYDFTIWDKWGRNIFRTKDIFEGWDGTFEGKDAHQDVYVYYCKFKTALGQFLDKRGTVTLIR